MHALHFALIVLSTLLSSYHGALQDKIEDGLVNSKVTRTVDLTNHLPKVTSQITLENTGKNSVRSFVFAVDPYLKDKLSFIGAQTKDGDEDSPLTVAETTVSTLKGKIFYRIDLPSQLAAGKSIDVTVETIYSHGLKAYPSHIKQSEKQFVQFSSNLYHYSPYKTTTQTTIVNCASSSIESYTKKKPVSTSDSTITYGPFETREPFQDDEMVVHFENNQPFLAVTEMTRLIEVSHWGNVAVEETIDIRHTGAILKGSFSRYDYQRSNDGVSSVKSFKTVLPASAKDVYYRDEIGNISTSNLREDDDAVEIDLRPRFPLFGGWKTHYVLGYNVPSYEYLFNQGDRFALKMRFVDHVFDDQVVDKLTVKVILPEGAKNIKVVAPFAVKEEPSQLEYTYLDTIGRPVIVLTKTNLVEQHVKDFEIHYTFQKMLLLQEPLLVVGAFYLLFTLVIIYVRLDFSITKDEASESKMRVAGLIEQVQASHDKRSALYQTYDDSINKFKSSKDSSTFVANRKKIDADYKKLTQQIGDMLTKLKAEGSDAADKVAELQKLDNLFKDQVNTAITYAEKLIQGKLAKQQYVDFESTTQTKKEDIYQKMEAVMATL
ncbi:unnamed protein product [Owenia fusiformis]|uniref:Dolichyl-diphosphooligosaccharide--protein glycosyltransferase subunit 1 n=1 Tax=Owenia fusiformis TaxID=6347 RepID=A0A8J1T571_OWEFU|nr:unnamed protein product [Owenia fusiformis]